ncbi:MAG: hypothetical protein HPY85_01355 [Anaerolineae bacterium]|nr:hypothetical protein [Anaerolineae bacterium]
MSNLRARLEAIFARFPQMRVLMAGDFFIDQYLQLERRYSETSLETGLEAYQVTGITNSLGAAGTVANNLCAMEAQVLALTMRGADANGYVMQQLMALQGIDMQYVVSHEAIFTPTYIKPMMLEIDGRRHELNRMDIKNRQIVPAVVEAVLMLHLRTAIEQVDVILVTDQVPEANCGVLTNQIRAQLAELGLIYPDLPIWVDSRERGGLFAHMALKTNLAEARKSLGLTTDKALEPVDAAASLQDKMGKPVLVTAGERGIAYSDIFGSGMIPAVPLEEPFDVVGAGDSVLAGAGLAIAAGATLAEAALVGCLAASVTVKKIGTTGTANVPEMLANLSYYETNFPDLLAE